MEVHLYNKCPCSNKCPSPNIGLKIGDFLSFFLEIPAANKRPSVNFEKMLLLPCVVSFRIYSLIIEQMSPFFSVGPNKR